MGLKNEYLRAYLPLRLSRSSKEFREKLHEKGLEVKTVPILFCEIPYKYYDDDDFEFYSTVDETVYDKVGDLLFEANISDVHLDSICSILKQGYVHCILSEINNLDSREINKELLQLYEAIQKNTISSFLVFHPTLTLLKTN